jgi:hypothetical protein
MAAAGMAVVVHIAVVGDTEALFHRTAEAQQQHP